MYQRTALIVEDEPLIRMILADAIEDEGYSVLEAGTALEAIAILGHHQVNAVITDVDMPGALNGLDLAKFIHLSMRTLPVIVTSGGRDGADCSLPGEALFIPKPYPLACMIGSLNSVLEADPNAREPGNSMRAA